MNERNTQYIADLINEKLIGATIVGACRTEDGECVGLVVRLRGVKEPHIVWIDKDAEGNGPGWISIEQAA